MTKITSAALLLLFVLCIPAMVPPVLATSARVLVKAERQGSLIRLTGQLIEMSSGRSIGNASVMIQCADLVLANKQTDLNGNFVLLIPEEKISEAYLTLKIRYREHIFVRERLLPASQDLQVEINRTLLLESAPLEDYRLPLHDLSDPRVGQVLIRTNFISHAPSVNPMVEI